MPVKPKIDYTRYPGYHALTDFLRECERTADGWMTLASLTRTDEGRDVWLATLTDPQGGAPEDKPAYYVQANMHSHEMCGTIAACHLIQTLLDGADARRLLAGLTFYIVPRVNPDGAEHALETHYHNRSRMKVVLKANGVIPQDLNGDGKIVNMRWEDPAGPFAVDPEDHRILVPRRPGDQGPFYFQYTEGLIHEYDGGPIVSSARNYDYNRNFPAGWEHGSDAAHYPFEHAETRAVGEFLFAHPNVFAGLDYHGGPPAIIYPAVAVGKDVPQADLETILDIGKMGQDMTQLPLMDGRNYRASWRKPSILPGSLRDFAYAVLGLSEYTVELGWGYSSAGMPPGETFDATAVTQERDFMRRILRFHDEHAATDKRVPFLPWEDFDHPQLGKVQIGGLTPEGRSHIYPPHLRKLAAGTTRFALHHAAYHPRLMLTGLEATAVAPSVYRVRGRLSNVGGFDTQVMSTGLTARTHRPVQVSLDADQAITILSRVQRFQFESLARHGRDFKPLEWFVNAAPGTRLSVRAQHPRGGTCSGTVVLS